MTYRMCKALLWVFTAAIPVFLAACYGSPMGGWSFTGKVVSESEIGKGINGILVSCIMTNGPMDWSVDEETTASDLEPDPNGMGRDYYEDGGTYTYPGDGWFRIDSDEPCFALKFTDVDGEEHYGEHKSRTIPIEELTDRIVLEIE